jgi:hypothetical protein
MPNVKGYVISCSSDGEVDARNLYLWGEMPHARWFAETSKEAKRRVEWCRKEYKCAECDAQVHAIEISRTRSTKLQILATTSKEV